jgi:hypothetical protein
MIGPKFPNQIIGLKKLSYCKYQTIYCALPIIACDTAVAGVPCAATDSIPTDVAGGGGGGGVVPVVSAVAVNDAYAFAEVGIP